MSRPMTFQELRDLLRHIDAEHSPIRPKRNTRSVKYVHPSIDMRTGTVFAINLRGYGWQEALHTQNECRDLPESLYERCLAFLKTLIVQPPQGESP